MRVALIGAADFNEEHFKSQTFDYCVAVDAGWEACVQAGIAPDLALGDFDSLGYIPEGIPTKQFPSVKNESDMELACMHAQELGAREILLYGAFSQRLDHSLANIQLMLCFAQQGIKMFGIGEDFVLAMLSVGGETAPTAMGSLSFSAFESASLGGGYAPYLSIFAIAGDARGVNIRGLAYEVADFTLTGRVSRGLSNQFIGAEAHISVQQGNMLVIFPLDAYTHALY